MMIQGTCLFLAVFLIYVGVVAGVLCARAPSLQAIPTISYAGITAIGVILLWIFTKL